MGVIYLSLADSIGWTEGDNMIVLRRSIVIALLLGALSLYMEAIGFTASISASHRESTISTAIKECQVTIPNGSVPPYNSFPNSKAHHGNGAMWTVLPVDGVLRATPQLVQQDGSIDE